MQVRTILETFKDRVYSLLEQIPRGRVTTYGSLAEAMGDKRAARAMGKIMNENPDPIEVPCHRVVYSSGELGGYDLGKDKKRELLKEEGIEIEGDKIVDFEERHFDDFESEEVLKELREDQLKQREKIITKDDFDEIETIGGVDVSYEDGKAYGALTLWKGENQIDSHTIKTKVSFPYISTYLSYREMPVLIELIKDSEKTPDVLMVDGNGILHPYAFGLASHIGTELDMPTIGVAKSKLMGTLEREVSQEGPKAKVKDGEKTIGYAYLSGKRTKNPIYVSPGHRVSLDTAFDIISRYCQYKSPEPIRQAHMLANEKRKEDLDQE